MNLEIKERITKGALELFLERGIKSITMDMLASHLSVSKRTIYEHFDDKEQLTLECLKYLGRYTERQSNEIIETSKNSFEILLRLLKNSIDLIQRINFNFFDDLKKMFPNLLEEAKKHEKIQVERCSQIIKVAQSEGLIMPEYDAYVLSLTFHETLSSFKDSKSYDYSLTPFHVLFRTVCLVFFRGIATQKGLEIIDEHQYFDIKLNNYK